MKYCTGCQQLKPLEEFHKHPKCTDGRQSHCKECQKFEQQMRNLTGVRRRRTVKRHKCTSKCDKRFGFCIKARNERRRDAFKKYGSPIFCKSGREVPQASFVRA